MDKIYPSTQIVLNQSDIDNAGRGVFATQDIAKDRIIEVCPIIFLENEKVMLEKSELYNYYFLSEDKKSAAIALGFGSLYNHSYTPNATYEKQFDKSIIQFKSIKPIKKGEEITVNYNYGDPGDQSPLWIPSIPHSENQ